MRTVLITAIFAAGLIASQAQATGEEDVRAICERVEQEHPLPAALSQRIVLEQKAQPSETLFIDGGIVSVEDAQALTAFENDLAPCREAMLSYLSVSSSRAAEARRQLFARNEQILSQLIAQRINFGEANRRWLAARSDFDEALAPSTQQSGVLYGSGVAWNGR